MLARHHGHVGELELVPLIVCLLIVALVAAFVYFACRAAGRPSWGSAGAAIIAIIGGLLCLAEYV